MQKSDTCKTCTSLTRENHPEIKNSYLVCSRFRETIAKNDNACKFYERKNFNPVWWLGKSSNEIKKHYEEIAFKKTGQTALLKFDDLPLVIDKYENVQTKNFN